MNHVRMLKLASWLERHPEVHDQELWLNVPREGHFFTTFGETMRVLKSDGKPPCGTTGCVAGWAVARYGQREELGPRHGYFPTSITIREAARHILDLTLAQADKLFSSNAGDQGETASVIRLMRRMVALDLLDQAEGRDGHESAAAEFEDLIGDLQDHVNPREI